MVVCEKYKSIKNNKIGCFYWMFNRAENFSNSELKFGSNVN